MFPMLARLWPFPTARRLMAELDAERDRRRHAEDALVLTRALLDAACRDLTRLTAEPPPNSIVSRHWTH